MRFDNYAYYNRYKILYGLIGCITVCCFMSIIGDPSKWINSAGLLCDVTGIVQLEISGFFGEISEAAFKHHEETGLVPSRYAREIIAVPEEDQTTLSRFEDWLKTSTKAGVVFVMAGCVMQLIATWLP